MAVSEIKRQEKYEMKIYADNVTSTDKRFTMDNLNAGNNYKTLSAVFAGADGREITRNYSKGERRNTNQTLPKIACQVFEKQLAELSVEEKENFPICRFKASGEVVSGIYSSVAEFRKHRNSIEYLTYSYGGGRLFVFFCWNAFSTILFA